MQVQGKVIKAVCVRISTIEEDEKLYFIDNNYCPGNNIFFKIGHIYRIYILDNVNANNPQEEFDDMVSEDYFKKNFMILEDYRDIKIEKLYE